MSSKVWEHFKIDSDERYAKCLICFKLISRGGTSKTTTNLLKHLKSQHKIGASVKPETGTGISSFLSKSNLHSEDYYKASGSGISSGSISSEVLNENLGPSEDPSDSINIDITQELYVDVGLNSDPDDPEPIAHSFSTPTGLTSPYESTDGTESSRSHTIASPITSSPHSIQPSPYPKPIKKSRSALKKKPQHNQPTLEVVCDRITKFKGTDGRAKKITRLIGEMVCKDLQPISVVENRGFRKLINHLEPRYTIPSRKTFANTIIKGMYSEAVANVKLELLEATDVAITTDMWTSVANEDYMAVTAHFYSGEQYNLKVSHKCLEVVPFTEIAHTAENLKTFLIKVLEEWRIKSKIVAVVRDNGADITAALARSPFEAIKCVAHTLQLVVKDGLIENTKINTVLKKSKKLVGCFKHSAKNTKVLKTCQAQLGLPIHRMIQDEPTRWNSSYHMVRRLLEQKDAIILAGSKNEVNLSVDMTADDWRTMEFAVSVLEVFEESTLQVSKSSSSIAEVIPLVHTIQHVLENLQLQGSGLLGMRNDVLASLKRRYADVESNLMYACATILDPRFKASPFKNSNALQIAKLKIIDEMKSLVPEEEQESERNVVLTTENTSKKTKGLWSFYKELCGQNESPQEEESTCETELQKYLSEINMDPKDGDRVPHYWANSVAENLRKVALKYLCVPACTVYSERLFSTAGNICDSKRNRLDPDRVKMLVFLNKNLE